MSLELYLRVNGDRSLPYGIVGSLTSITINNVPVRVGDLIEFTHGKGQVQGLVVVDPHLREAIIWGWASLSRELFSNTFDLKLIPNVSNIRAGQQISYRIYAREYNEPNIM